MRKALVVLSGLGIVKVLLTARCAHPSLLFNANHLIGEQIVYCMQSVRIPPPRALLGQEISCTATYLIVVSFLEAPVRTWAHFVRTGMGLVQRRI